jgi:hypothetical protein
VRGAGVAREKLGELVQLVQVGGGRGGNSGEGVAIKQALVRDR